MSTRARAKGGEADTVAEPFAARPEGVFHDIVHALSTILVLAEAVGLEPGLSADGRRRVGLMKAELRSVQDLAGVMLGRVSDGPAEAVALDDLVASTAAVFAETQHTEVVLDLRRVLVTGSRSDLRRLVANLLQNAFAAADQHGSIHIQVEAARDQAILRVADSGPGFGKLHREGTRWGLSVVRAVVGALGGELELGTAEMGGAEVTVRLPRAGIKGAA